MASSDYNPAFPRSIAAEDKIRAFVSNFYQISDDPTKNEEWVSHFLPDAVLVMGPDRAEGVNVREPEIRKIREKMWEKVAARKHQPLKVFESNFADDGGAQVTEYMLYGDLVYKLKTGESQGVSWAGNMVLKQVEGELKFSYYRVYIQR
ncbi:hypothetical protein PFICI_08293 [Pestalotiopsis fici W106-1]|uniref:SnoaL-like domain-containing protein n=1 Tax=Pestalotiopsis fici (strain W106-1 / CGMCC3.15140) TaxID=1229662 RepID=W3X446_PESFW|nr:uncharacterized protein PFICI_08293 [Pestalotiopsis fici W106-1]ETS80764.1 hypothetical protein PFICI_08293 [Pestalotiopsis fici W106-1]